ncbi:MAG: hypothetical protein ACFNLT_07055, partial [Eikenella halliae]
NKKQHDVASCCSYSELTKTSTALPRLAVLSVLSAARRLVLIFVNSLYIFVERLPEKYWLPLSANR